MTASGESRTPVSWRSSADGLDFSEYSLNFTRLNERRGDISRLSKEAITAQAVASHENFITINACMQRLELLSAGSDIALQCEDGFARYDVSLFPEYLARQKALAPEGAFRYTYQPTLSLFQFDLINSSVNGIHYGLDTDKIRRRIFKLYPVKAPSKIEKLVKELELMAENNTAKLAANGIETTGENVAKMWVLEMFLRTSLSSSPPNDSRIWPKRILDLIKHKIPLDNAMTALSWYGNPEHNSTGRFTYSAEALVNFNDIPKSYMDHIIWDEFIAYSQKAER